MGGSLIRENARVAGGRVVAPLGVTLGRELVATLGTDRVTQSE